MGAKHSVSVVIPCLNEEALLEKNMTILHNFMAKNCDMPWNITIFSNGSTDRTVEIGTKLSKRFKRIKFLHIPERGRAKALRLAWLGSKNSIVGYMDADLSTELGAVPKCLNAIVNEKADVAIGNRLTAESEVERSPFRELLSRGYNVLIRIFFPTTRITDAQCGFKFFRKPVVKLLLHHVQDNKWFFDTELILLSEHCGFNIAQIPVAWAERKESKVKIGRIIVDYVWSLMKLRARFWFKY